MSESGGGRLRLFGSLLGVRTLLSALWLWALTLPLLALAVFRTYENQLVRRTEEALISEAVVVGESARQVVDPGATTQLETPQGEPFVPLQPTLDLRIDQLHGVARRAGTATTSIEERWRPLTALLERAELRNLTGVRVLDSSGVVVASPKREVGYSLAHLPEVRAAMEGRYEPALHERGRHASEPHPSSLSRASAIHVSIAVPVFSKPRSQAGDDDEVIAIVYDSRTPMDVEKSIWRLREELVVPALASIVLTLGLMLLLSRLIAQPLVTLAGAARRVADGHRGVALTPRGFAPKEVGFLSESLERMRTQLEGRAEYVRTFAANAAHELKSPLTSIRGAAELLLEAEMSRDQARKFLENVLEDAVRMDKLVQRLLVLARVESSSPNRSDVELGELLDAIAERHRRRGQPVQVAHPEAPVRLFADPEQLEAMFGSLIDNAVRHGGPEPVEVTLEVQGRAAITRVRDHGPEVPEELMSNLFERFFTTERARGGTGLGLSIVRAVAEGHGGEVHAVRRDRGLELVVQLPVKDP